MALVLGFWKVEIFIQERGRMVKERDTAHASFSKVGIIEETGNRIKLLAMG